MATAFGLVGVVAFIACVIALAAAVTWAVVKISPTPGAKKAKAKAEAEAKPS